MCRPVQPGRVASNIGKALHSDRESERGPLLFAKRALILEHAVTA